ncbi:O-antigen ligase family protein [Rathayibacter sp. VKM Ac-2803]|uniref:O-antigen ligase family protein n=1 Tax=unclassified Rathayibacter TaxID=2609250 RepID=UPI0013582532|nr:MULTISPECIES: O-antigen ligase family protein [unclassified Rathayibacter]MWV50569.1 O-antigen ligase family protein [Rathayibacter sp. VKM Ac-2803]MWV59570.1 O-antigen ligase family protein [Rathayibacter sp. VKM Ac-2754]
MIRRAAPAAPRALAVAVLTVMVGGQALRNLLGWWGWGAVVAALLVACVALVVRERPRLRWSRTPKSLVAFLALAVLSLLWSAYPGASAIGIVAQLATTFGGVVIALTLGVRSFVTALGRALRITVGLSLLFELVIAVFVRQPVLPVVIDLPDGRIPDAFYWSLADLFTGEPIQGIVGNRNLLGFVALLGLIVVAIELASHSIRRRWGALWAVLFVAALLLTRSSTVILCAVAVALAAALALWARRRGESGRRPVYATALGIVGVTVAGTIVGWSALLGLLGKSDDATGRLDIWRAVWALASERPVLGWGWVSYWAPWAAPFDTLAERKGVLYLQAHDAWLDVWFQLGIVGLVLFVALAASTLWRSWFRAVDRPRRSATTTLPYSATSLAPLLLSVALLAQSLAESRILIEGGWLLLVALAVLTKQPANETEDALTAEPIPLAVERSGR